jgi:glycerol transport system ATP-binding protein
LTATLSEGRITQFGPTSRVYRNPVHIDAARVFSDPPLNELPVVKQGDRVAQSNGRSLGHVNVLSHRPDGDYRLAFRADAASIGATATGELNFSGAVVVTEISGSESFVHVDVGVGTWVCLVSGVHDWTPGQAVAVNIDPTRIFAFDSNGQRVPATIVKEAAL